VDIQTFRSTYSSLTEPFICLCGSKISIPIKPKERFEIPITFGICLKCGHIYAKNVLSEKALDDFYTSSLYRSLYGSLSVQEHIDKLYELNNAETALWRIAKPYLPDKNGSVLEWGSSGGWNLIPFRDFGHNVLGLDVSVPYIEAGKKTYDLDLRLIEDSTFDEIANNEFDVIILNHVLEHLNQPGKLLTQLAKISSPHTVYLIGLPTIEAIPDYGFQNYFTVAHIHYFSKYSFASTLKRSGFSLLEVHRTHGGLTFVAKVTGKPTNESDFKGVLFSFAVLSSFYIRHKIRRLLKPLLKATGVYSLFRKS
jgi:2-polyprenyl-3-methyl-5-hydroxy-6-metoxy-1,4-benzoquinol methylase